MRTTVLVAILAFLCAHDVNASLCQPRLYTLDEIAGAPVLAVVRMVSLKMATGARFQGDPKQSAPPQEMTAVVDVLRSFPPGATPHTVKIRFTGRDGPDFSWCPEGLPELPAGQTLLVPLSGKPRASEEFWRLAGTVGDFMTTRVAGEMGELSLTNNDPRQFIIRELVNSLSSGDAMARYTAAVLLARQAQYLDPELTSELQKSLQGDQLKWARVLESIFLSCPSVPLLTVSAINSPRNDWEYTHFQSLPLARIALSHLTSTQADVLVWHAMLDDLPALTDEPYHPLFSYSSSPALGVAYGYLLPYRDDPTFVSRLKLALREGRPGSSQLADIMIDQGQKVFLPEALDSALKVIARPEADGGDIVASMRVILKYGSKAQRDQCLRIASDLRSGHPDYAAYLERLAGTTL